MLLGYSNSISDYSSSSPLGVVHSAISLFERSSSYCVLQLQLGKIRLLQCCECLRHVLNVLQGQPHPRLCQNEKDLKDPQRLSEKQTS